MREEYVDEFDPILNAQNFHKAQMIKDIILNMGTHVSNIFDEIENVYTSGSQIDKDDIIQMVTDLQKDLEALKIYFK